jgi:hypothetical protein
MDCFVVFLLVVVYFFLFDFVDFLVAFLVPTVGFDFVTDNKVIVPNSSYSSS